MLMDFILFSVWEGLIFYFFIKKLTNIELKITDGIIVGVLFCISSLIPPLLRQVLGICIITFLIFKFRNKDITFKRLFYILKWVVFEYIYAVICETFYCSFLELLNIVNLYDENDLNLFLFCIPLRIIEVILIFIINKIIRGDFKMKQWIGSGVVRK